MHRYTHTQMQKKYTPTRVANHYPFNDKDTTEKMENIINNL